MYSDHPAFNKNTLDLINHEHIAVNINPLCADVNPWLLLVVGAVNKQFFYSFMCLDCSGLRRVTKSYLVASLCVHVDCGRAIIVNKLSGSNYILDVYKLTLFIFQKHNLFLSALVFVDVKASQDDLIACNSNRCLVDEHHLTASFWIFKHYSHFMFAS
jgi:hypothetical protein